MRSRAQRWLLAAGCWAGVYAGAAQAQVFVVGMKSATDGLITEFHPTRIELPSQPLTERGRRELLRMLEAEQGFAHRALPMGGQGLTLRANGNLAPDSDAIRKALYEKGISAQPGDRVVVTHVDFNRDAIILDLDGGPYLKHRFLRHLEINGNQVAGNDGQLQATGSRVILQFEGHIPELSAAEVKSLLQPVIDFGVKTSEQAYADTLPEPIKLAVADHKVLVGMSHRMVIAAIGQPKLKIREKLDDATGTRYEEWIYGQSPETMRFVRFIGDRVVLLKIAELGKPLEVHDQDEMAMYHPPEQKTKDIALGDRAQEADDEKQHKAPSLRRDGEQGANPASPSLVQLPPAPGDSKTDPDKQQQLRSDLR